jgi:RecA-family ATPase
VANKLPDPNKHPAEEWNPPMLGHWLVQPIPEQKYLLDYVSQETGESFGFLPTDSKMLVSGKPKVAKKSLFAFATSLIVASGKPYKTLVPTDDKQTPVLILQAEGARTGTRDRWNWIANAMELKEEVGKLPIYFDHRTSIILEDDKWFSAIRKTIETKRVGLIVLDPLVMYMKGDENNVADVRDVMKRLGEVAKTSWGTTIMFVHHLNKGWAKDGGTPDVDDEIRGSSAIAGFYDVHYAIRKKLPDQKHNELTRRAKDDEEALLTIEWEIDKNFGTAGFELVKVEDFDKPATKALDKLVHQLNQLSPGQSKFKREELKSVWQNNTELHILALIKAGKMVRSGQDYLIP